MAGPAVVIVFEGTRRPAAARSTLTGEHLADCVAPDVPGKNDGRSPTGTWIPAHKNLDSGLHRNVEKPTRVPS